ncbi:MAG: hypothetical protein RI911_259 [Candidatus Parcubacteria bacterium]|jgi:hypothetical protein
MKFINNTFDSVVSPGFYATMRERKLSTAVAHLILLALLCAVAYSILSYPSMLKVRDAITAIPDQAAAAYPEKLVFVVEKGKAHVMGMEEPVIIPLGDSLTSMPDVELNDIAAKEAEGKNIIIDTQTQFSIEELRNRNGFAWVGADGVYTLSNKAEIKGFAYGEDTSFAISKTIIDSVLEVMRPYYVYLLPVMMTFVFLAIFFGIWIGYLFYALILAILVKLYYWLFLSNPIPYGQAYKTSIFAMSAPILVFTVLSVYGISISYAFTALTLCIIIFNTYAHAKSGNEQVPTPPQNTPPLPPN